MVENALRAAVMICLSWPAVALAQGGPGGASLVGVSTKAKGGPNLAPQVKKLVEKPLGKQVKTVPFASYQKAGKAVGVRGPALLRPESAPVVGGATGVTHVLFIEGQTEKQKVGKKAKKLVFASVSLVEVASGDVVFTTRYELKARKIDKKIAGVLMTEVLGALISPAAPPSPPAARRAPADRARQRRNSAARYIRSVSG